MNKFLKALLASIVLYITVFVALITVNPFPANNFMFVGHEPGKYQFMSGNAVTLSQFGQEDFDSAVVQILKRKDKDFPALCEYRSSVNSAVSDLLSNSYRMKVRADSSQDFTAKNQADFDVLEILHGVCAEVYWKSQGDFSEHWSRVSERAKQKLADYGIKNDNDVLKFLGKL